MKRNVHALDLDLRGSHLKDAIESEEIGRFEHLRYLNLNWGTFIGDLANCLTESRWIFWSYPSPTSKPINLHLKNVVVLEFSDIDLIDDSTLEDLIKMTRKLKVLSLTSCDRIIKTPDFSECPTLERLSFEYCSKLRNIDGSIGKLKCLIELRIYLCDALEDLPDEIGDLVNLQHFCLRYCRVKKFPVSIWKLKSLHEVHYSSHFDGLDSAYSWELPSAIGMLQKLEVLLVHSGSLKGQLPSGIGSLPFLRILDLSYTGVSEVPNTITLLPRLQRLELMGCNEIQELPMLPTSLTHLVVSFKSLWIVPDLSNLTNLVQLVMYDWGEGGDKLYTGELRWIGRLSKLTQLRLRLHNVPVPAELASLRLLNRLGLFGFDLQTPPQLPLSLQELCLDNFKSVVSLSPDSRNLSRLELSLSPMQEFQLDGLQLPNIRKLLITRCELLERFKLTSMRKLKEVNVAFCPKLVEIQFSWFESLEVLYIQHCESFERLVHVGEAGHDNNESTNDLIGSEGRLILPLRALNMLESFLLAGCPKIHEIQFVGSSESCEYFSVQNCPYVQILGGLSNLKNLKTLSVHNNNGLRVVEGLDELEFLDELRVHACESLERLVDVSSTKIPNDCHIHISGCRNDFRGSLDSYKHRKVD